MRTPATNRWAATALALTVLLAAAPAPAAPWIDPGDVSLRNDIQLLADAGVLRGPVTTWPLSWGDVARDALGIEPDAAMGAAEREALIRLRRLAREATRTGVLERRLRLSVAGEPRKVRTFEDTPRESAEIRAGAGWTGLRFSYRLQFSAAADAADDRPLRADGSYFGVALGNFMLAAGQMERWWGPGWDGSLILSSNARPIPAIALRRNFSDPFQTKWLRWIGPWTLSAVWGQLEQSRGVPDARFFGLRVNFRPTPSLELGVSRTAQWCGRGRPCDAGTFADLLLGNDNRGENTDLANEPGNQLAGVDWRWRLPTGDIPLSWYGQLIGEDEAGGLPSRMIGLTGVAWWGYSSRFGGALRAHLEIADTAAEFYAGETRFDYAYEHFIYSDGYRYRNRSIGHSLDNDGRMISAGLTLDTQHGTQWRGILRVAELNRGGVRGNSLATSATDLFNLEIAHRRPLGPGRLDVGLGMDLQDPVAADSKTDIRAHLMWQSDL